MTERNEHKNEKYQDGDIYLNPCFGDLWVVDGTSFIKINNGYAIDLDEPEGFIKVGHIDGVINRRRTNDSQGCPSKSKRNSVVLIRRIPYVSRSSIRIMFCPIRLEGV